MNRTYCEICYSKKILFELSRQDQFVKVKNKTHGIIYVHLCPPCKKLDERFIISHFENYTCGMEGKRA